MPKESRKGQATPLSPAQIDSILALAADRYRPIFAIAAFTGCRISEALKLKAQHVDLIGGTITFTETKTGHDRTVPISAKLRPHLEALDCGGPDSWLFPSPRTASHITRVSAADELRAVCESLGYVGVSTHSFRRSVATNLSDLGQPLKTIASLTGHRSLDQLARYIDVTPKQQLAAVDLL
jgi:integrase/recombinase XerD